MKYSAYLFVAILILQFSSCSKKDETKYDPSGALAARLKSITYGLTGETISYSYTGEGKIQLVQSSLGNKTTYEYINDSIRQTDYDKTGTLSTITTMVLDSLGLAISGTTTDANGNILGYQESSFDTEKHKTSELRYTATHDINGKSEWVWGGGNMYQYSVYDSTVTYKAYDSYIWYYDPAVTSFGNANTGRQFLGTDSKYLVRKIVGYTWGQANNISTFEYLFDGSQRITQVKTYNYSGTLKSTDTYTYY